MKLRMLLHEKPTQVLREDVSDVVTPMDFDHLELVLELLLVKPECCSGEVPYLADSRTLRDAQCGRRIHVHV